MYINKQYEFSNFGTRLAALLIDFFLILFIWIFIVKKIINFIKVNLENFKLDHFLIIILLYIISGLMFLILYRSFFDSSKFQGTPGKIILGIKIVNHNFEKITFNQAILRNIIKFFSSIMYIGYLIALLNEKCITLHDTVAKTYVIREIKYIITNKQ